MRFFLVLKLFQNFKEKYFKMWLEDNGKLVKHFEFKDFNEAISFLNKIAKICNEVNHHPEIYNCYNEVKLSICTFDSENNITKKDYLLAKLIDKISLQNQ